MFVRAPISQTHRGTAPNGLLATRPFGAAPALTPAVAAHDFARVAVGRPESPIQRARGKKKKPQYSSESESSESESSESENSESENSESESSESESSESESSESEGSESESEKPARKRPRVRKEHPDSEGESESEDPNILYRSLRDDEDPLKTGLLPPKGHDPNKTARQHVTAGTRSKAKSPFVSFSRSMKLAGAWASKNQGGRVAKVKLTPSLRKGRAIVDLTEQRQARSVFPTLKGSSYNTALSSQEVLVKRGLPKESVLGVYNARKVTEKEYGALKEGKGGVVKKARSRAEATVKKKKTTPHRFVLEEPKARSGTNNSLKRKRNQRK